LNLVAKLAKATILPTSHLKSIRHPNTILKDQPRESFALQSVILSKLVPQPIN
jgi:hypothetical protein